MCFDSDSEGISGYQDQHHDQDSQFVPSHDTPATSATSSSVSVPRPISASVLSERLLRIMPRVVANQRARFDTDEFFQRLKRLSEIRYTGTSISAPEEERHRRFEEDCAAGLVEIVYIPSGFNLELNVQSLSAAPDIPGSSLQTEQEVPQTDFLDTSSDPHKIFICSHFILNGVCVKWRGYLDRRTLIGQGALEFDEQHATEEHQRLVQQLSDLERQRGGPGTVSAQSPSLATPSGSSSHEPWRPFSPSQLSRCSN